MDGQYEYFLSMNGYMNGLGCPAIDPSTANIRYLDAKVSGSAFHALGQVALMHWVAGYTPPRIYLQSIQFNAVDKNKNKTPSSCKSPTSFGFRRLVWLLALHLHRPHRCQFESKTPATFPPTIRPHCPHYIPHSPQPRRLVRGAVSVISAPQVKSVNSTRE